MSKLVDSVIKKALAHLECAHELLGLLVNSVNKTSAHEKLKEAHSAIKQLNVE